jgi:hypothetical protein
MKYIIILILLILIILLLINKKNRIEYREKYSNLDCDFNCGKYENDEDCLSCSNCGLCTLTDNKGNIKKQCLPGTKNGSFFNEYCMGKTWLYYDDATKAKIKADTEAKAKAIAEAKAKPKIITQEVKQEVKEEPSEYDKILLAMGQNIKGKYSDIKPMHIVDALASQAQEASTPTSQTSQSQKEKPAFKLPEPLLPPVPPHIEKIIKREELTTYEDILNELESLSSFQ